jgi:hypothetical protein
LKTIDILDEPFLDLSEYYFKKEYEIISIQEKAMLGPTRLRFIEGRFEPKDGVGAFLDPEGICTS